MFVLHDIDCVKTKHFHNSGWVLFCNLGLVFVF